MDELNTPGSATPGGAGPVSGMPAGGGSGGPDSGRPGSGAATGGPGIVRAAADTAGGWERSVLEKLVLSTVEERRRARRWGIFFKLTGLTLALVAILLGTGLWDPTETKVAGVRHTARVDIEGVIEAKGEAAAEEIGEALRAAFADVNTAGVVLRINSPGGSPVQAGIIHDEILRLRAAHPKVPVYAVIEEVCASGGYYVAAAAERIYVDKASLVGSIGVLMSSFGVVDAMEKLGVERRLLTAGRNKGYLDMFSPLAEEHRAHALKMLDEVHQQFIDVVRKGRGARLKEGPDTFSGFVWTGARSVELGLADGLGSLQGVARDVIKADRVVDFTRRQNIAERLAKRVGASAGQALIRSISVGAETPALR